MKNFIDINQVSFEKDVIILDVRRGDDIISGRALYEKSHIKGAYYLDLEVDLSGEVTELTGAHPLPDKAVFKQKLQQMGATNDTVFYIYDDGDQFVAARAWFVLKYFGITSVKIINGGFPAIKNSGLTLTNATSPIRQGTIQLVPQEHMVVDFKAVQHFSTHGKENTVLLDARSKVRYLGESEPLYDKAGHIPRAQSYFYQDVFDANYALKSIEALQEQFQAVLDKEIMIACGSGVTAAMVMIALDELDKLSKVYVGSYSQWIKRGQDVETKDETIK